MVTKSIIKARRCVGLGMFLVILLFVFNEPSLVVQAQNNNTISGNVFGFERLPLSDVNVELLDDLSRLVARTRTNASGRYFFGQIGPGRFKVRVLTMGTDYEEQEQEIEIVNFVRQDQSGTTRLSGFSNEQRDFYLRFRKGVTPGNATSIFVQEIPKEAKGLYDKAINAFNEKKDQDGINNLKKALEIFPNYYYALDRLGREYLQIGSQSGNAAYFQAAELLLMKAVEVNPRGYNSWYGLAYAQYSQKRHTEGYQSVQKAIELNSSSPDALLLSGTLARILNKSEDAEKALKKANELSNGKLAEVHWQLALLYGNNMQRYNDAANELETFIKLKPESNNENIKSLIAKFREKANTK